MTHLIFVDGLPGSGKSESSKNLATSLAAKDHPTKLFIETDPTNPLHTAALDPQGAAFADAHIVFNIEGFAHQSLQKYQDLQYSLKADTTTIFESFPIQSHVRVLLQMDAEPSFIDQFWLDVQTALKPLAPALVFFEEKDPVPALERILEHRGEQWADYIISALEGSPYAVNRSLKSRDGIIRMFCDYNDLSNRLVASWSMDHIILPARPQDYAARDAAILEYFGDW